MGAEMTCLLILIRFDFAYEGTKKRVNSISHSSALSRVVTQLDFCSPGGPAIAFYLT